MKCPACGLYHPPQYQKCASCGTGLVAESNGAAVTATQSKSADTQPISHPQSRPEPEPVGVDPRSTEAAEAVSEAVMEPARPEPPATLSSAAPRSADPSVQQLRPEPVSDQAQDRQQPLSPSSAPPASYQSRSEYQPTYEPAPEPDSGHSTDSKYGTGSGSTYQPSEASSGAGYGGSAYGDSSYGRSDYEEPGDRREPAYTYEEYPSYRESETAQPAAPQPDGGAGSADDDDDTDLKKPRRKRVRRSKTVNNSAKTGIPTMLGVVITVTVLLVSAGATVFFFTKQPDEQRLFEEGQKQLANGQYAFAVKTLTDDSALRPKDPKVFLALARAYVGVDQVDKAWECISHAQQLGAGVIEEPTLASDLANYYRQRGKYEKAIDLLRPLAKADVAGKKAELADLDALWGDEELRNGNLDQALRCWEEVRDLREGSRFAESDARLATIYQRLANNLAADKKDDQALVYINKLNNIAQNARNYQMAADLYERQGQLDLAIDQLRKAISMSTKNQLLDRKLSKLLARRGKELLDQGNSDTGYAYLQQARDVVSDGTTTATGVALRNINVGFTNHGHMPEISGQVWNPTEKSINALTLKVELVENTNAKVLWSKEDRIIDDFVPPLGARDSKPFDFVAEAPAKGDGTAEFNIYIDGTLYKTYPIGATARREDEDVLSEIEAKKAKEKAPKPAPAPAAPAQAPPAVKPETATEMPPAAPPAAPPLTTPSGSGRSAEEKTMKDLDL